MKQEVLSMDDIKKELPFFKTRVGKIIAKTLFKITDMDKVNDLYKTACEEQDIHFVDRLLKELNIKCYIEHEERLNNLPEGFVTVSNHPFGGIDGIILIDIIGNRYPEYRYIVNWILNKVQAMSKYFICVDPVSTGVKSISVKGIKDAEMHLKKNLPLGLFPSGSVSEITWKNGIRFEDIGWNTSACKMIKGAKKPVLPIYFHGHNSPFFYLLGLLGWKIRSMRLPCEVFNKKGKTIHITIGEIITPEEQEKYKTLKEYGDFLKNKTYQLRKKTTVDK